MAWDYEKLRQKVYDYAEENNLKMMNCRAILNLNGSTWNNILNNKSITLDTVNKLCNSLKCYPQDIITYIPDWDVSEEERLKQEKIAKLKAQLAELES